MHVFSRSDHGGESIPDLRKRKWKAAAAILGIAIVVTAFTVEQGVTEPHYAFMKRSSSPGDFRSIVGNDTLNLTGPSSTFNVTRGSWNVQYIASMDPGYIFGPQGYYKGTLYLSMLELNDSFPFSGVESFLSSSSQNSISINGSNLHINVNQTPYTMNNGSVIALTFSFHAPDQYIPGFLSSGGGNGSYNFTLSYRMQLSTVLATGPYHSATATHVVRGNYRVFVTRNNVSEAGFSVHWKHLKA